MTFDDETSFSRIMNEIYLNASIIFKVLGGISIVFFPVCQNRKRVLLTGDLFQNISLAVGQ